MYDRQHGIQSNVPRDWSIFTDETNLRRVQERQAWAQQAEERSQARLAASRKNARQRREAFLEQQRVNREQAEMVATMLDALCQLGSDEQEKGTVKNEERKVKRNSHTKRESLSRRTKRRSSTQKRQVRCLMGLIGGLTLPLVHRRRGKSTARGSKSASQRFGGYRL